jgi:hypothetical protein
VPLYFLQDGAQALGILGAHPIEFEAVADQNRDFGLVFGDPGLEWLDPGVELLLGQFLGQLFHALQPELFAGTSGLEGGVKGGHKNLWTDGRLSIQKTTLLKIYPQDGINKMSVAANLR